MMHLMYIFISLFFILESLCTNQLTKKKHTEAHVSDFTQQKYTFLQVYSL